MIYDASGKALVENQANAAITLPGKQNDRSRSFRNSQKLSELIEMPVDKTCLIEILRTFGWQMKTILKKQLND